MEISLTCALAILVLACSVCAMPETSSLSLEALAKCPCSDPKLCEPITEMARKEQFAFSVKNDDKYWNLYDWSKLTTVATADYVNISLVCLAHTHNARVIYMAQVDEKTFMSPDLRKKWIDQQLTTVRDNYLDGLNFDYEGAIGQNESAKRDAYSALVKETRQRLQEEFPYSLVAVDVGWRPNVDERFYDYPALANSSDFLVLMAYDEQSQIYGECLAGPNCPYSPTVRGVMEFLHNYGGQISSDKLILAIPWFGISYQCLNISKDKCYIKKIPYRGAPCSDSPGQPYDYKDIHKLHLQMPDKYVWNETSFTPYITYTNQSTGSTYQVQYDDLRSLKLKYEAVSSYKLRGVGIFHIDMLDYTNTPEGAAMRSAMFGALPPTTEPGTDGDVLHGPVKQRPACPCNDTKLCDPITDYRSTEVVAFSVRNDPRHWSLFDWSKLTTIVMFNYMSTDLMCLAHSHGVRVVIADKNLSKKIVFSKKLRSQWIEQKKEFVYNNYLDGINFDFEDACSPSQRYLRQSFSALVRETRQSFRQSMPHAQISVDVILDAFSHYRDYNYQSLAYNSDFLFIMAYDESIHNVGANSAYGTAKWSIQTFLKDKIHPSKLVLGLPWYGDVYQCASLSGDTCHPVRFGHRLRISQVCYGGLLNRLESEPDLYRWNSGSQTPYFSYKDFGASYQAQFDDPRSLTLKYQLAREMGIRGVGIWHIDCLNFSSDDDAKKMRAAMFDPLPTVKEAEKSEDHVLRFVKSYEKQEMTWTQA